MEGLSEFHFITGMRVIHLITDLSAHGAQMMLYKLLSASDRRRFNPIVVSLRDRGPMAEKIESLGVPVYGADINPGISAPISLYRLLSLVGYFQPDVIQGWMYHANLAALLVSELSNPQVPVLWNIRGSHFVLRDEKPFTAAAIWLGAKLSKLPARIINNSDVSALKHGRILGYCTDKTLVIPNGFDTDAFAPSSKKRACVCAELGIASDSLLIGLIARYHPMKDHHNFLGAAALLHDKPKVHFILAGESVDTNNKDLLRTIENLGLSSRVHLLGQRSDIPEITAALDIASSSSFSEGFPNTIGEAMACAVPCVVTDVGDSAWIVGQTGRVVPPRDAPALARAWQELIDMGPERRQALGRQARQRVRDNFSLDHVVRQYETLYEQVASVSARARSKEELVTI